MFAVLILSVLILLTGIAGYCGISDDPWYRRKLDRDRYPFEELIDSADEKVRQRIDNIINESEEKNDVLFKKIHSRRK